MNGSFSAPTVCNIEITEACNQRCRHCYNHWRSDHARGRSMDKPAIDRLIELLLEAGVFHVILSGGEPFLNFDILEYAYGKLAANNISFSCNSNLILATPEKIKRLMGAGVDHVLTSLNSHVPAVNDAMVCLKGSHELILKGINTAVEGGLRVSANMIICADNLGHVYDTGRLAGSVGCQKLFATRTVPPARLEPSGHPSLLLSREQARGVLSEMVRLKDDTGIMIGTLVSYPLCLLGDLDTYRDFVGRGCPAQSGHAISIGVGGETHACVHQSESAGNVFEIGIKAAYANLKQWRDGSYTHEACLPCDYVSICRSGCRSTAHGTCGSHSGPDPLMVGPEAIAKPFAPVRESRVEQGLRSGARLMVPRRLRFRREDGFTLVNIRWANTVACDDAVAGKLLALQGEGRFFTLDEFGARHLNVLAQLLCKDALESPDIAVHDKRAFQGLGADLL